MIRRYILFVLVASMSIGVCSAACFGCRVDSLAEAADAECIKSAVAELISMYPEARLADIYKSAFQDRYGPGHIIADTVAARQFLHRELEYADSYPGPLFEPTIPRGCYYRVNLRVLADSIVPEEAFFSAFIAGASKADNPPIEEWSQEWHRMLDVLREMQLDSLENFDSERQAIEQRIANGNYVGHHSRRFEELYQPHYRIVYAPFFIEGILPYIERSLKENE